MATYQLQRNKFHLTGKSLPNSQAVAVFLDRMSQVAFPWENNFAAWGKTSGPRHAENEAPKGGKSGRP
jgi:hypothetical protein